jgi:molybdenum cofactor cytidylyltransferase
MIDPSHEPACIGVLLAAGRGRRMGQTKQLLSWPAATGAKPLVAAAFDALQPACSQMVVVLGHEADAVAAALANRPFHSVLSDPDAALFDSIRAGLRRAQSLNAAACVLLHPADHPEVSPNTLDAMLTANSQTPDVAIVPEFAGRGGHPVLLPPTLVRRLLDETCPAGLGQFWRDHPQLCRRIALDDPNVVRDVDVPTDFPS